MELYEIVSGLTSDGHAAIKMDLTTYNSLIKECQTLFRVFAMQNANLSKDETIETFCRHYPMIANIAELNTR